MHSCTQLLTSHLKETIYISLLLLSFVIYLLRRSKLPLLPSSSALRPLTPDLEKPATRYKIKPATSFKAAPRAPGVWIPVDFQRPPAIPYPDWDIETTDPIPYRPFRHGPYYITMGLRSMEWDEWIELDNRFLEFHEIKKARIQERGEQCCRTAPEAYDAAVELLGELADYLPQRYPTLYTRTATHLTNLHTKEAFPLTAPLPEDPMRTIGLLVQDDIAIMLERPDGQYYLLAGSILLAGFWRLRDKFGMPLSEIHTSGDVPGFKEKLEKGMMNFFRRIQPAQPVLRNNYFLQVDNELAWSNSIGSEDYDATDVGGQKQVDGWSSAEKDKAIEHHFFRSERQSLRRLPKSGGVVFTIRTYFEPVTRIAKEKGVPGRLANGVRSWGEDSARYKGRDRYESVLLEYLDRCHREQVERGEVNEETWVEEQSGKYPY